MTDSLPPDPYAALGVSRDADAAAIKSAYRKLALKYHPDKAKGMEDEFHRIRSAFEILGEDESRRKYDDSYYLETMRNQRRGSRPNVDIRTAAFDMRSGSKPGATFTARGPTRYEERRPKFDDDYRHFEPEDNRASSRKPSGFGSTHRKTSSRSSKPTDDIRREAKEEKVSPKERAERKKQRDRDTVREREVKYAYAEAANSDSDEIPIEHTRERRRVYEYSSARGSPRGGNSDDDGWTKYHLQASDVREYISRARAEAFGGENGAPPPPPPMQASTRSPSYMDPEIEVRRVSKDARPAFVKRSSTRSTKEKTPEPVRRSSAPQRKSSSKETNEEYEPRRPQPPPIQTHFSSGAVPQAKESRRSKTDVEYEVREPPRPTRLSRSETMPAQRSANRRGDTTPVTSSNLRHAETHDSGYSTSSPSEAAPPTSFKKSYTYAAGDIHNQTSDRITVELDGYPTVLREPNSRSRQRSPEEIPRGHTTTSRRTTHSSGRSTSYDEPDAVRTPRSSRRPSISQTDSSPRVPGLQRGQTMPLPRTGRTVAGSNPDLLPFEIPRAISPTEMNIPLRTSGYRPTTVDDIKWAPSYNSDEVKFTNAYDFRDQVRRSSASAEAFGNRGGKDSSNRESGRRSSTDQMRAAREHMEETQREAAFRPAMRKTPTTAY